MSLPSASASAGDLGPRPAVFARPAASDFSSALRPRLRLTPAGTEAAPARTPEPSEAAGKDEEWTWKELLSSIEERPPADDGLAERMQAEIAALGLDSEALLPANRIEEISAVLHARDFDGAREVVRMLAGSAVRRLAGRLLADELLRAEADIYVRRYDGVLKDTAKRDRDGLAIAGLLNSEEGRAFLLLDAAAGGLH